MEGFWTALANIEGPVLLWFQEAARRPGVNEAVSFFTHLGDGGMLWVLLCALLLLFPRTRRAGLAGAAALVFNLALVNLFLKPLVDRTRPWLMVEGLAALVYEGDPHSFPSGHTSASFACALAWWGTLPGRWRYAAVAAAVAMGLSRLYVGVHFPTDVLCGALAGAFCGWAAGRMVRGRETL